MSTPLNRPYRRRNVAKLLARLHPKGISEPFAGGRSTAPERETALDIAGALGAAGQAGPAQRLAIHVLCLRWWPGLFEGPSRVVGYRSVVPTAPPTTPRSIRRATPCATAPALTRVPVEQPAETAAFRALADLIGSRLAIRIQRDRAAHDVELIRHLAAWVHGSPLPNTSAAQAMAGESLHDDLAARVLAPAFRANWARAVIEEYRNPNHCPSCHGYGERLRLTAVEGSRARVDVASCDHCIGQGVMPWSKKRRAQRLVIGEHPFRQFLNAYHEGALALLRELEHRGAVLLLRHLGSDLALDTE